MNQEINELNIAAREELRKEVSRQIANVGRNEFEIAVGNVLDAYAVDNIALTKAIVADIQQRELVESEEKLIESYKSAYRLWMDTQTPRSASEMRQAATLLVERADWRVVSSAQKHARLESV